MQEFVTLVFEQQLLVGVPFPMFKIIESVVVVVLDR